jgi:hypothetical protein
MAPTVAATPTLLAPFDLDVLARRVRAILADPWAPMQATDDAVLDWALADLARHRRAGRPLCVSVPDFWLTAPQLAHVPQL